MREHETEPVPGLPEQLPKGETILWQGSPDWTMVAVKVLHIRAVAIYFVLLLSWFALTEVSAGATWGGAFTSVAAALPMPVAAFALFALYAYLVARSALYTITSKRVVMRIGIAVPVIINIPFGKIASADLNESSNRFGDISFTLNGDDRQSFVLLWPHVRPWRTVKPEPMFRCIPNAREVAAILAAAVAATSSNVALTLKDDDGGRMPAPLDIGATPVAA